MKDLEPAAAYIEASEMAYYVKQSVDMLQKLGPVAGTAEQQTTYQNGLNNFVSFLSMIPIIPGQGFDEIENHEEEKVEFKDETEGERDHSPPS